MGLLQVQFCPGGRRSLSATLLLCSASLHSCFVIWIGYVISIALSPTPYYASDFCCFLKASVLSALDHSAVLKPFWIWFAFHSLVTHLLHLSICWNPLGCWPLSKEMRLTSNGNCSRNELYCTMVWCRWIWALQSCPCQLSFIGVPLQWDWCSLHFSGVTFSPRFALFLSLSLRISSHSRK